MLDRLFPNLNLKTPLSLAQIERMIELAWYDGVFRGLVIGLLAGLIAGLLAGILLTRAQPRQP